MKTLLPLPRLTGLLAGLCLAIPSIAAAEDDLGVTLRIVEDDQELDESFVNELQMPTSLEEETADSGVENLEPGIDEVAGDVRDDMLELETTLGEQSRETRDALDIELTGELETELPELETPSLDDPSLEDPDLGLPELESPDLQLDDTQIETLGSEE